MDYYIVWFNANRVVGISSYDNQSAWMDYANSASAQIEQYGGLHSGDYGFVTSIQTISQVK